MSPGSSGADGTSKRLQTTEGASRPFGPFGGALVGANGPCVSTGGAGQDYWRIAAAGWCSIAERAGVSDHLLQVETPTTRAPAAFPSRVFFFCGARARGAAQTAQGTRS